MNNNLVPVLFRGKTKYLKPDLVDWVKAKIDDPKETLEQAIERLYIEGLEEQREQQVYQPNTMDYFIFPRMGTK